MNKKSGKLISLLLAVVLMMSLFAGCSQNKTSEEAQPASASDGSYATSNPLVTNINQDDEYIFILCLSNIEYFNAHKYEWSKLGGLFGVKTSIMGVADFDLAATASTIEQAIAKKPKGICLFGVDPTLNASIDKAVDAGIPVVSIIGDQKGSKETAYIGSSGEDLG